MLKRKSLAGVLRFWKRNCYHYVIIIIIVVSFIPAVFEVSNNITLHKNIHTHHLGIYWVCRWKRIKPS